MCTGHICWCHNQYMVKIWTLVGRWWYVSNSSFEIKHSEHSQLWCFCILPKWSPLDHSNLDSNCCGSHTVNDNSKIIQQIAVVAIAYLNGLKQLSCKYMTDMIVRFDIFLVSWVSMIWYNIYWYSFISTYLLHVVKLENTRWRSRATLKSALSYSIYISN